MRLWNNHSMAEKQANEEASERGAPWGVFTDRKGTFLAAPLSATALALFPFPGEKERWERV